LPSDYWPVIIHKEFLMKILICSDGSARSKRAVSFASIIVSATRAETTIFGITENQQEEGALKESLLEESRQLKESGVQVEIATKSGDPVTEIIQWIRDRVYDLVVIGAERRGAQEFFLPSAKAYSIAEAISPPVLVVPRERHELKRILICSGGGRYIENAVRFATLIAKDLSAKITLLNVVPEPPAMHGTLYRQQEDVEALLKSGSALARNLLNEKKIIEDGGVSATIRIAHGLVIDQILSEIARGDHDLVVAGSWAIRDRWRTYAIGNITREIVNRTDRPVLVMRSDKKPKSLANELRRMVAKFGPRPD
jgi:nucleotide-binding universal stress UspA family protein